MIYLRKSRSDKSSETVEETLQRHESQLQELALKTLGKEITEKNIYREVVSGGEDIESRPEFMQVLKRLEDGNIKGVFVVDPQRLSRSGMYGAGDIINAFYYTHTLIITPNKTYDLNDEFDKKFIEMELLQGAEYLKYTKQILERGRMQSLNEGKFIGSDTPYGYDKEKIKDDKGYKLIINQEEAEVVKMIFDLYVEELSTVGLANYLNKLNIVPRTDIYWKPDYVRNILCNPTYYGMLTWQKRRTIKVYEDRQVVKRSKTNPNPILVKGLHEPIVSKEQYDLAQSKMKSYSQDRTPYNAELKNALAGLIKCGICGYAMIRKRNNVGKKKRPLKRKYELNKQELIDFLQVKRIESQKSLTTIANEMDVTKGKIISWLSPQPNRVYFSKNFSDNWFKLKEVLNIHETTYDEIITTYEESIIDESIVCSHYGCKCISSYHHLVEKRLIEALRLKLTDYKHFLDNYEEEIIKDQKSNLKAIERIDNDIEKLNKRLKNAKKFYELEDYTREEYLETKKEIEKDLQVLEKNKKELSKNESEDKLIKYKKAVPKLESCLEKYNNLTIPKKNEMLKDIIEEVIYTKNERGHRNTPENNDKFKLQIKMKL